MSYKLTRFSGRLLLRSTVPVTVNVPINAYCTAAVAVEAERKVFPVFFFSYSLLLPFHDENITDYD
jgi:hypothetical protein